MGMCRSFARVDVCKWDFGMCRCFARVDVNGTLYRGFARASIQVDVTISIHVNKDDMT